MAVVYDVKPGRRGVPRLVSVRATELGDLEDEVTARRSEDREAWGRVIYLAGRGHLSVVADRPDVSDHTFGEIRSIATRSLRRLDGGDAA